MEIFAGGQVELDRAYLVNETIVYALGNRNQISFRIKEN